MSIDLRQICLDWPRPLLPWGFHSSAIREMLSGGFQSVWPIHRHFMRLICRSMGSSFVKFNSAGLLDGVRSEYSADDAEKFVYKNLKPVCDGIGD